MSENLPTITEFAVTIKTDEKSYPAYCAEHDCEANVWSGGSGDCYDCRVCETSCDCVLVRCVLVRVAD